MFLLCYFRRWSFLMAVRLVNTKDLSMLSGPFCGSISNEFPGLSAVRLSLICSPCHAVDTSPQYHQWSNNYKDVHNMSTLRLSPTIHCPQPRPQNQGKARHERTPPILLVILVRNPGLPLAFVLVVHAVDPSLPDEDSGCPVRANGRQGNCRHVGEEPPALARELRRRCVIYNLQSTYDPRT